jgi:hypothetical protein
LFRKYLLPIASWKGANRVNLELDSLGGMGLPYPHIPINGKADHAGENENEYPDQSFCALELFIVYGMNKVIDQKTYRRQPHQNSNYHNGIEVGKNENRVLYNRLVPKKIKKYSDK